MARRRKKKSNGSTGVIIAGVAISVLSAALIGGFIYLRTTASTVALDRESLCPLTGPASVTAILLDVTDPISDVTALDLRNEFQILVAGVPQGGLIQVYALTDQEGRLVKTFSGCNPGDGSTVGEWTSNPRMVQARWEAGFEKPLRDLADRLREGNAGKQSPIMAAVQRINVEAFGLPEHQSVPKTLVVASDMIEHTASFSMYRDGADFVRYEGSEARQKFRSPLSGVVVRILEFQRPGMRFTDEDLARFWSQWVSSNMGELTSFKRLQGVM
ncbi:hypothetical protein [Pannonibacter phragmitetus]|uniref:Uncharacterized protein n=1 Tax=Pannonibacter phragmitetus TaxID=121719 RepID=A0A378ZVN5_9HYPH|nr:hypothetical protein [Pannonibacter phragmitetus]MBA4204514.1 hypothetical protein [Polymorphum sp.]SUB01306.1 Uncharacterised protein [Pannonibacter phragmitetus]